MFAAAELGRKLSKEEYDADEPVLRNEMLETQMELAKAKFPVILLVGGVDAAGKGETVNMLLEWMDPRHIEVNSFGEPSDEERERPYFWRFWRALPPRGKIGIFYGSWYTDAIVGGALGEMKRGALERRIQEIRSYEKMLADDGALIIKVWLHLSRKAQKKRFTELESDPRTRWRVTKRDWSNLERYDEFIRVSEAALRATSVAHAPWTVVEGEDWRYRQNAVAKLLLDSLKGRLGKARPKPEPAATVPPANPKQGLTVLGSIDLTQKYSKKEYEKKLEKYQGRLNQLARKAWQKGVSTVVVYEGWDAAGKGGNIRRLTAGMDARNYRVTPIAAPTDEERQHPYLWRFWRHIPRAGRVTIFDRSWYGRVMVERIEGFCTEDDWKRAYSEINDFEAQLTASGIVVVKFWLQISKEEQLRRFEERKKIAYKRFKITDEDWRNRKKWDAYEAAVNEMIERCSTDIAPWTLVEANDKLFARIRCLRTLCDALEAKV
ncbi:MAG: polyphosphate:AMP phosphotransferase [Candidatus Wallbacteria bacterium]|nr:polyphosphate:AMP phosphotransferase [Candidatus Wallbacteria bacterium]